jgi:hypothetical protein
MFFDTECSLGGIERDPQLGRLAIAGTDFL